MYIIGIDLASRKSAYSILREDKTLWFGEDIELKPIYKYKNDIDYFNHLKKELQRKLIYLKENLEENCIIVLEHNVRNETLTKTLGMWLAILSELKPLHIHYEEPSAWYSKLKLGAGGDKREVRKQKAKDFFYKNNPLVIWEVSEDMADSYCIAMSWFYQYCYKCKKNEGTNQVEHLEVKLSLCDKCLNKWDYKAYIKRRRKTLLNVKVKR